MAWFGEITELKQRADSWLLTVAYYSDLEPSRRFTKTLALPLSITKVQAVAQIKARGVEVARVAALNEDDVVGQIVSIPV